MPQLQLQQLGANQTLLRTPRAEVLFSYETPVAAFVPGRGYFRTDQFYSKTTLRHINHYLRTAKDNVSTVSEAFLARLLTCEGA